MHSHQPRVKSALHEIWYATTKDDAEQEFAQFEKRYGAKYPKALENLQKFRKELMAFYYFPAKDCPPRNGVLHMVFKRGQCAQKNWHRHRGFSLLAKVITEVRFKDRIEVKETVDQRVA